MSKEKPGEPRRSQEAFKAPQKPIGVPRRIQEPPRAPRSLQEAPTAGTQGPCSRLPLVSPQEPPRSIRRLQISQEPPGGPRIYHGRIRNELN